MTREARIERAALLEEAKFREWQWRHEVRGDVRICMAMLASGLRDAAAVLEARSDVENS
jgi:hypothetical protein